ETERDHALDRPKNDDENDVVVFDDQAVEQANRDEGASSDQLGSFEALGAEALFDRVLFDGGEFGTGGAVGSEDELDFIGIPGLLEHEQVHELLRTQQARQAKRKTSTAPAPEPDTSELEHRAMKEERNQLQSLVGAWARRTGTPHQNVHVELRRACGGPAVAQATREQIQARIKKLQGWFIGRKCSPAREIGHGPRRAPSAEAPRPDPMPAGRSLRAEGPQAEQTAPVESRGRSVRVEDGGDGRFTVLQPTRRARQLGQGLVVTGTGLLHTGRTHE